MSHWPLGKPTSTLIPNTDSVLSSAISCLDAAERLSEQRSPSPDAPSAHSAQDPENQEEGSPLDDLSGPINADSLRFAEHIYTARKNIIDLKDARMVQIDHAIRTWMLKLVGIFPSPYRVRPTVEEIAAGATDPWASFVNCYGQIKGGTLLSDDEWKLFKKDVEQLAQVVIQKADIICATTTLAATDLMKGKVFDVLMNGETSVTTALETLMFWKGTHETVVYIGDHAQLGPVVMTGPEENPFYKQLGYSTFARFRDILIPSYLLNVQERTTVGLGHMASQIFYDGKILDGEKTRLDCRPLSQIFKEYTTKAYPTLEEAPPDLIYPVMLNTHGQSYVEIGSKSNFNPHHVAVTVQEIIKFLTANKESVTSADIGIATPYRAQLRQYTRALKRADEKYPTLNLRGVSMVKVGTTRSGRPANKQYSLAVCLLLQLERAVDKLLISTSLPTDSIRCHNHANYDDLVTLLMNRNVGRVLGYRTCMSTLCVQAKTTSLSLSSCVKGDV